MEQRQGLICHPAVSTTQYSAKQKSIPFCSFNPRQTTCPTQYVCFLWDLSFLLLVVMADKEVLSLAFAITPCSDSLP